LVRPNLDDRSLGTRWVDVFRRARTAVISIGSPIARRLRDDRINVDHKTGGITKAEKITDADDLKNAKEQSQTMAKAKVSLKKAVEAASKANSGYRAVSATPTLDAEKPVANITLMKGEDVKNVTEKLD
jgi:hypothetical protein